jgi:hypothetical protein
MEIGPVELPKMDGMEVSPGIWLIGEPTPIPNTNLLRCLARVGNALCLIELSMKFGTRS